VSDGNKCYCGFDDAFLDEDRREDECRTPCAGDDAFTCGEDDEFELYRLYDDVPGDSGTCLSKLVQSLRTALFFDSLPSCRFLFLHVLAGKTRVSIKLMRWA